MRSKIHDGIAAIPAREWNALEGAQYPMMRHEFLRAAEETGCADAASGWLPRHLALHDDHGRLRAAMPLYEKSHSWGEFVFDWGWAEAYEHAGLAYYPKLVSAVPFTPTTGPRLLTLDGDANLKHELLEAAIEYADAEGHSSLHVLFPAEDELPILEAAGLTLRKDCQFHWHNKNYQHFDDFLSAFSSTKRKKAKRDRRHVAEQGIHFRWVDGGAMDEQLWTIVHRLICNTFLRRGSPPYFNQEFFRLISQNQPDTIQVVLAERDKEIIATAVFFLGRETLYGRYWGSNSTVNALHFETCYYQGIDYCIRNRIQSFEPGTQGEHKISRGFTPVGTWSAHWLARPEFADAVERYVGEEKEHVERYIDVVHSHSPYKGKVENH